MSSFGRTIVFRLKKPQKADLPVVRREIGMAEKTFDENKSNLCTGFSTGKKRRGWLFWGTWFGIELGHGVDFIRFWCIIRNQMVNLLEAQIPAQSWRNKDWTRMARKVQNRKELRRQHDAAEQIDPVESDALDSDSDIDLDEELDAPVKKKMAVKAPRVVKPKVPKPAARKRVIWVVFNDSFKPIAQFEFNQKEEADKDEKVLKDTELKSSESYKSYSFVFKNSEIFPEH